MDNDDTPIGTVLSRREVLALSGAAALAACTPGGASASNAPSATTTAASSASSASGSSSVPVPSCVVRPALTEGPYFVDEKLDRSDIRADPSDGSVRPGTPLQLVFSVARVASACTALAGAQVDVWHCDASGVYSDASDPTFGSTKGRKFLRGFQVTDAQGQARFSTIYPGWYQGRAVHIHFKIRTNAANGAVSDFTSQLFFDEAVTDEVYAQAPYTARPGSQRLRNERDGIYQGGGARLLVKPARSGAGYAVTFEIGLAS